MTTGKEMCELISKYLKETKNMEIDPIKIWEYSPSGELQLVFTLYDKACEYYGLETERLQKLKKQEEEIMEKLQN